MNKPFFLHIFIGITLILAACESKKKETQKNSWSIDEPQVVSQAGEIRAQITAFGRSAKDQKLYTSDKIRFKTQKGVTLYIDTTCSQLNHTFRHKVKLHQRRFWDSTPNQPKNLRLEFVLVGRRDSALLLCET